MSEAYRRKPWFRPRTYGFGWTPISWEGWLVSLGLAGLLVLTTALLAPSSPSSLERNPLQGIPVVAHARQMLDHAGLVGDSVLRFGAVAIEVAVFLLIGWATSEPRPPRA